MYPTASIALKIVYLMMPCASLFVAILIRSTRVRRQVLGGWVSGLLVGSVVLIGYSLVSNGSPPWQQVALTLYLGVALMLMLKIVDRLTRLGMRKAFVATKAAPGTMAVVSAMRVLAFTAIALPWVMSALMVYRPRLIQLNRESPLAADRRDVSFKSRDGTAIAGWYFPPQRASNTTALLCHGLAGSKCDFNALVRRLAEEDIGVLTIDLRGHCQSGGQISTFGAQETLDVLAAVDWLKSHAPRQSQRIVGIGETIGASALLNAAAIDTRIDGVAVISGFDTLSNEVRALADARLFPPVNWLVRAVGLPFASLHAGVDLSTVRPIDKIADIWPRPVLVIHATQDDLIPFDLGRRLYDAASPPRDSLWVDGGVTHNGMPDNPDTIARVIEFVRWAQPVPVI